MPKFPVKLSFLFLVFFSHIAMSQTINGTVYDDKGELLPFSSVLIKGTTLGSTANNRGKFQFNLSPGTYTLVCQHVGYAKEEKKITLGKNDEEVTFILAPQKLILKEVIVKSNAEDPAYEIIRQAIKKRPYYSRQVKAFECEVYIKGLVKLRSLPNKIFGKKIPEEDRKGMGIDSSGKGIIYLSESVTKVALQHPDKVKLEVVSGRQSGSGGFGFSFPTFISLYENNVKLFANQLNPRGFVSPIAEGALNFYRYKFMGSFFEDGKEINVIRVIPKRTYEPLFSGVINITDGEWRIHSCDLLLTKTSQLQLLDTLQISQIHVPVTKDVWRVKNQVVHINFNQLGIDAVGNFVNVYSKYNIDPHFPKNYFDRVIVKFDTSANKKTKQYWDTIRPVPLEPEEARDYKIKDSLYQYRKDSVLSKRNIDSLKKRQGDVTPKQVFWTGIDRTHYSKTNTFQWHFEPLLKTLQFTSVEGLVIEPSGDYHKFLKAWKTNLTVSPNIRYGFNNNELNAWVDVNFRTRDWSIDKKLKRESWNFSGGRRVSQFNKESAITPLGNTVGTLLFGNNNLKIYGNYFGNISFTKRFESGFRFNIDALYEDRSPLDNSTDFVIIDKNREKLTPNYPFEVLTSNFASHQALIVSVDLSVKPGQRYIQFPFSKVPIGSKYPTFAFNYTKGIKTILGSDVDFDKWKFSVFDDVNLKLFGSLKYKASVGGFLNTNSVYIQDWQHYNGNTSTLSKEYVNTFQLAGYYQFSNTSNFYALMHLEHHFNGLLTNKIPLLKKWNWNLVDGVNALYIDPSRPYAEVFAGIENIFKILRIDGYAGFEKGKKVNFDVRIGVGGIIGGSMSIDRRRTRSIGL